MKLLLFTAVVLSSTANAEVIKCPDFYPSSEVALSVVPSGHKGSAILRGARLSNAYIATKELYRNPNDGFDAMVAVPTKVKGGWDMEDRFTPKDTNRWLVCVYGGNEFHNGIVTGNTEWWEKLDQKFSSCVLQAREIKKPYSQSDWTATAVCK